MDLLLDRNMVDLLRHLDENNAPVTVNIKKIQIIVFMNISDC